MAASGVMAVGEPAFAAICTGKANLKSARTHASYTGSYQVTWNRITPDSSSYGSGTATVSAIMYYLDCGDLHEKVVPQSVRICLSNVDASNDPYYSGLRTSVSANDIGTTANHYWDYYGDTSANHPIGSCVTHAVTDQFNGAGDLFWYKVADQSYWTVSVFPNYAYAPGGGGATSSTPQDPVTFSPSTDPYVAYY